MKITLIILLFLIIIINDCIFCIIGFLISIKKYDKDNKTLEQEYNLYKERVKLLEEKIKKRRKK